MASQYERIKLYPEVLWSEDSPALIEEMVLSKDMYRAMNVLHITYRNMSSFYILGLSISISARDINKVQLLDNPEYHYYNLQVAPGKTFGADIPVDVAEDARFFTITVTHADFSDNSHYPGSAELRPMPEPSGTAILGEFEEEFIKRFKEKFPKAKLRFGPEEKDLYWRCTCGRIYSNYTEKCPTCRISRDELFGILAELKEEKRLRLKKEARLERERREAAERLERERREAEERRQRELEEKKRLEEEERLRKEEEERRRQEEQKAKRKKLLRQMTRFTAILLAVIGAAYGISRLLPEKQDPEETLVAEESTEESTEETLLAESESETEMIKETEVPFYGTPVAVIGADLSEEDQKLVMRLIGLDEEEIEKFHLITMTSEVEHQYLDGSVDRSLVGNRSLSCLLLTPTEPGSGLNISMYNITYCTAEMYEEALLAAGITDAEVVIAGPFKTTGTSALAGCMMMSEVDFETEIR